MDIRRKTLLALAITFVVLFSLIAGLSIFLYIDQLGNLEHQEVKEEVTEVLSGISNEQDDLSNTLHDWAYWDETYQFALDQNEDYIAHNLDENSLAAIRLNLFLVTDTKGNIVYGKAIDPVTGHEYPLPADIQQLLPPNQTFLNFTSLSETNTSLLLFPSGPMLVASSPVLTNTRGGPSHGVLVMGRSLEKYAFPRISRVSGNAISAYWGGDNVSDSRQMSLLHLMNPDSAVVSISNPDGTISGYEVINDINGRKILIDTVQSRDLYQTGLSIIQTYTLIFSFIILVTLVIVLVVIDRTIMRKLHALTDRVRKIGQGYDDDMKPEFAGTDEIAQLEKTILSTHADLIKSDQELRKFSETLAVANKKLTLLSRITRHDIKNQLMALIAFLELSSEATDSPAQQAEYIKKSQQVAWTIERQISFTREYEQIGVTAPVWQEIRALIDDVSKQVPLGTVTVKAELTPALEVFADPLIAKVFHNLIDNAVQYGEKITTIRFWAKESGDNLILICEDDGVGINTDEKQRIFEHGYGKNTGLGLALSKEILEITDITIRETGEPGKGARFEMTVPKGAWRNRARLK